MLLRIDKILSQMGLATRSEAKRMVRAGRLSAGGRPILSPEEKLDPEQVEVCLDGSPIAYKRHVCLMMNKPAGYLSATEDGQGATVLDLLPKDLCRRGVAPAGRLDKDAEGLLLLTDDGDLIHRIISPGKKVWKRYYVRHAGLLGAADVQAFEEGLVTGDGLHCKPAGLLLLSPTEALVSLTEGKFHQVKRMLASRGAPVLYLKRISIGGLQLDKDLESGAFRQLAEQEVASIFSEDM